MGLWVGSVINPNQNWAEKEVVRGQPGSREPYPSGAQVFEKNVPV